MEHIPKELEDIILDYKVQLETTFNYKKLMKQFEEIYDISDSSIGTTKELRLTKINSHKQRYSTFCKKCGNYGEMAEAIYIQNNKNVTHKNCDFTKQNTLVYFHRITSKYYDELPDNKFCYCIQDVDNFYNILL